MKQYLFFLLALTSILLAHAQTPGIPYQATLLAPETQLPGANSGLIPLKNTDVCLRFTFKSASGTEYQETQTATTSEFGRIDLVIGNGTPLTGSFAGINWDGNPKTMEVDIDYKGLCANFEPLALNEFQYVPYAFFALNAGSGSTTPPTITATANPTIPGDLTIGTNNLLINVDDADSDPTNEIQDLTLTGNTLKITGNASATDINLAPYLDNTDNQIIVSADTGNLITAGTDLGALITSIDDADADPANEIQDLSITGNTLKITGNASATDINLAPYLDNTDNQIIVSADTGNLITAGTDLGALITSIDDADADPANEIQDLTITGNTLKITGNATSTDINLAPYLDNTDNQIIVSADTGNLITAGTDLGALITSIDDADADPANEIQDLEDVLLQNNDAGGIKISNLLDPTLAQDAATKAYVDAETSSINLGIADLNALSDGKIYVGDATNAAAEVTLSGDITMTNTGATTIANDAVTTVKISDANVTDAKLAAGIDATKLADGTVSNTELQYIGTLTSDAQTQISDLTTLADGKIYVGDATNAAAEVSLSGDITMTNTGATTIANDAVTTVKISDANVTDAKLAAGIDATKLADGTVSNTELQYIGTLTSDVQTQISDLTTLADGKIYVGDATNAAAEVSLSGDITMTNTGATTIANDAVTTVKISDANVTDAKLAAGIDATKLADGTVSNTELQYIGTLTSDAQTQISDLTTLADGKIYVGDAANAAAEVTLSGDITMTNTGATTIANDAVTTVKISDANVTDAKLAAGIDATKLADGTVSNTELQYIGTLTSDAQTQISDLTTLADGKIYVGDATNVAAEVTLSGDITMTNTGVTTIANDAVTNAKIATGIDATKLIGTLPLANGGTGSNTALGARNSLKIFSGSYSLQSLGGSAEVIQVSALTGLTELPSSSIIIFHSNKAGLTVLRSILGDRDFDVNSTLESIDVQFGGSTTTPGDKVSYLIIIP